MATTGHAQGKPRPKTLTPAAIDELAQRWGGLTSPPRDLELVRTLLSSSFPAEEHDGVGRFVLTLVDLAASCLAKPTPLSSQPGTAQLLRLLFLCDPSATYFLSTYGAVAQRTPEATAVHGDAAYVPPGGASKYYIANLNRFADVGGFEAMIRRVEAAAEAEEAADDAEDIGLFVEVLFGSRFVLTRLWATTVWPRLHTGVTAFANLMADTLYENNLVLTKMLWRLDAVGRFLSRLYLMPWDWASNSDTCVSYNLQHTLQLLSDESTEFVTRGATYIGDVLKWVLGQTWMRKLEPTWVVSDWLVHNSIKEALDVACGDTALTDVERKAISSTIKVVLRFHEKVPQRPLIDPPPRLPITLYLKTAPTRPSFGTLHLDCNGVTTTVGATFLKVSHLLGHPPSSLMFETQAGKQVLFGVHSDWAMSSVSPSCTLNVYIRPPPPGTIPGVAPSTAVPAGGSAGVGGAGAGTGGGAGVGGVDGSWASLPVTAAALASPSATGSTSTSRPGDDDEDDAAPLVLESGHVVSGRHGTPNRAEMRAFMYTLGQDMDQDGINSVLGTSTSTPGVSRTE